MVGLLLDHIRQRPHLQKKIGGTPNTPAVLTHQTIRFLQRHSGNTMTDEIHITTLPPGTTVTQDGDSYVFCKPDGSIERVRVQGNTVSHDIQQTAAAVTVSFGEIGEEDE